MSTINVLLDTKQRIYCDSLLMRESTRSSEGKFRPVFIEKYRLRTGLSDGVDVVELSADDLSIQVLPTRGMGIAKGTFKNHPIGWNSPVQGPVHPSFVRPFDLDGIGWLNGFDEFICRCGLGFNGAPGLDEWTDATGGSKKQFLPLHGLIANQPAHKVEAMIGDDGSVQVKGTVDEGMLFFPHLRLESTTILGRAPNTIELIDVVSNPGGQSAEVELLYHCNFGPPFAEPGSQFYLAAKQIVPRNPHAADGLANYAQYPEAKAGVPEQVYFFEPMRDAHGVATALLTNQQRTLACVQRFHETLPWFTLWKNPGAFADGYVTGLEPGTDFPNNRKFERSKGRVIVLEPGESREFRMTLQFLDDANAISETIGQIEREQQKHPPKIHPQPHPDWCS